MVSVIAVSKNTFWELDISGAQPARPRSCSDASVDYRSLDLMMKEDAPVDTDDLETLTPRSSAASVSDWESRWSDQEENEGEFPPGAWSTIPSMSMFVAPAPPMALHVPGPVFPAYAACGVGPNSAWNCRTTSVAAAVEARKFALGGNTFAELARAGMNAAKRSEVAEHRAQKKRALKVGPA